MDRIKSAAMTALGLVVALATLGFFASFGLVVIGIFAALGLTGAIVAGVAGLFATKPEADTAQA